MIAELKLSLSHFIRCSCVCLAQLSFLVGAAVGCVSLSSRGPFPPHQHHRVSFIQRGPFILSRSRSLCGWSVEFVSLCSFHVLDWWCDSNFAQPQHSSTQEQGQQQQPRARLIDSFLPSRRRPSLSLWRIDSRQD